VEAAKENSSYDPPYKPIREEQPCTNEWFLKTPGRTTRQWVGWQVNAIGVCVINPGNLSNPIAQYVCLVAKDIEEVVTREGDSGTMIVDKDFRPIMMVNSGEDACSTMPDITRMPLCYQRSSKTLQTKSEGV